MNPSIVAAVAQFAPTPDAAANLRQIGDLVRAAASGGARLVVLPEEAMLLASEVEGVLADVVVEAWPAFLRTLSDLSVEADVWIIAGGYEPNGTARPFNTLAVVATDGRVVEQYRKVHLYDAFDYRESDYVTHGDALPPVVIIEGIAIGLVNCYDLRFPELSRDLVSRGADVLSVSAAWVAGEYKREHWSTLVRARAIENTAWVIAAGSTSDECIGDSLIVDPMGVECASLGPTGAAYATVEISLDRIAEVRETLPALANRRLVAAVAVRES